MWQDSNYTGGQFLKDFKEDLVSNSVKRGADTLIKSSVASSLIIGARNGALGESMKSISSTQAAVIAQVGVESAKAIMRWQRGEISAEQAASESTKAGLRVAASMAGKAIRTAIPIPVLGTIIGSYLASSGMELIIDSIENSSDQIILTAMANEFSKHTEFVQMRPKSTDLKKWRSRWDEFRTYFCESGAIATTTA